MDNQNKRTAKLFPQVRATKDIYAYGQIAFRVGEWMDVCEDQNGTKGLLRVHFTHEMRVLIPTECYSIV